MKAKGERPKPVVLKAQAIAEVLTPFLEQYAAKGTIKPHKVKTKLVKDETNSIPVKGRAAKNVVEPQELSDKELSEFDDFPSESLPDEGKDEPKQSITSDIEDEIGIDDCIGEGEKDLEGLASKPETDDGEIDDLFSGSNPFDDDSKAGVS